MVKLEHHGQLSSFFTDVLTCFELAHSTWHLSNSTTVVFAKNFQIHFMYILVDFRTAGHHVSVTNSNSMLSGYY